MKLLKKMSLKHKIFIALLSFGIITSQTMPAFAVETSANAFSDVPQTHPNYLAINYWLKKDVIKGYSDGTFKPQQLVNRAEALKMILAGNGIESPDQFSSIKFNDVKSTDWFAKYVVKASTINIVNGNPDGTFAPGRTVSRSEFLKMLLTLNGFKTEKWLGQDMYSDVPKDAWYTPYMNYSGQAGLLTKDEKNNIYPAAPLSRADVAEIMYLMAVIRNGGDTQFLLNQADLQMAQIEIYIGGINPIAAKRAAELGVDMTQQAYNNMPTNNVVVSAAKLARAYDFLVNSYISGIQKKYDDAKNWANQAIAKATEAWEANNEIQSIAKHIKDSAKNIINQIPA